MKADGLKCNSLPVGLSAAPQLRIERAVYLLRLLNEVNMINAYESKAYHGGASFEFIGARFDDLSRVKNCINADVLDAWFDPSPMVISKVEANLPWILRTSPPTHCEGLLEALAEKLDVATRNLLAGAGSSSLIFLAMQRLLNSRSKALTLDPTYGEYLHIFEQVIGVECVKVPFQYEQHGAYSLDLPALINTIQKERPSIVVLVNPNSPTGTLIKKKDLEHLHKAIPKETILWVDETYIDYVDCSQSLTTYAVKESNIIVCKSLSKVYALSGARSAYLCSNPEIIDRLSPYSPPWAVSLPAQIATIAALQDDHYYSEKYRETREYREILAADLRQTGFRVHSAVANFLLIEIPADAGIASGFILKCRKFGLYLRDISSMGRNVHKNMIRIAVKDHATNKRAIAIIEQVLSAMTRDARASS